MGHTFYKGNSYAGTFHSEVVKHFIKGEHLTLDKYGKHHKTPLNKGATRYNLDLLRQAKGFATDYRCLISVESTFIRFMEKHTTESRAVVSNIWRIITAQNGTVKFLDSLSLALKKYKVEHQDVYSAICHEFHSYEERRDRNALFLTEWAKDCGLLALTSLIEKESGKSFFEWSKDVANRLYEENNGKYDDDFYKAKDKLFMAEIEDFAKAHNISIEDCIIDAVEKKKEHIKEVKVRIKESNRNQRIVRKYNSAKQLILNDANNIFHAIENANEGKLISNVAYNTVLEHLLDNNGTASYIAIVKNTCVYYLCKEDKLGQSVKNALWFRNPKSEEIKEAIAKLKEIYPEAIIEAQTINLPNVIISQ